MQVLVSGSSGFIGQALVRELKDRGHTVIHLSRHGVQGANHDKQISWDNLTPQSIEGVDAVFHLAGENIFARWTKEKKQQILDSRVNTTRKLAETLAAMQRKPEVLVCASATGYYGDAGDKRLDEVSSSGDNFLAEVCRRWEKAAEPAREAGIRVVHMRQPMVLHPSGSSLKVMYIPFVTGVAGNLTIGGHQYMPWITREDDVNAFIFAMENKTMRGPVNACAPNPVTNDEFTRTMKKVLTFPLNPFRYWAPPLPKEAIWLAMGQMGTEMLVAGQRAYPVRLEEAGFTFKHPKLEGALRSLYQGHKS